MAVLEIRHLGANDVQVHGLDVIARDGAELWVELPPREVMIGRRRAAGQTQIQINDAMVSVRHCAIVPDGDGFGIRDLMSSGGTLLNDGRVLASETPRRLANGDCLRLGTVRTWFHELDRTPLAPPEAGLVSSVAAGEAGAREVYADWLEERGDSARAEFLRDYDARRVARPDHLDPTWRLRILGYR